MSRSLQSSIHHDYRILVLKCFENTNILPAYVLGDSRPYRINEDAIKAIKDELLTGRGVSVGYYADQSRIELRHLITELKCFEYYERAIATRTIHRVFTEKCILALQLGT